jgi:hypothetical protein
MLPVWMRADISVDILDPLYPADFEGNPHRLLDATRDKIHTQLQAVRQKHTDKSTDQI